MQLHCHPHESAAKAINHVHLVRNNPVILVIQVLRQLLEHALDLSLLSGDLPYFNVEAPVDSAVRNVLPPPTAMVIECELHGPQITKHVAGRCQT